VTLEIVCIFYLYPCTRVPSSFEYLKHSQGLDHTEHS